VSDKDILSVEEAAKGLSLKEETRKQENKKTRNLVSCQSFVSVL
jgi:hypothetical protein